MNYMEFYRICKMSQADLKKYITNKIKKLYDEWIVADGYVFARGIIPVCLVAHMDTVHKRLPVKIYKDEHDNVFSDEGIGGDDRCGIYMILRLIEEYHCSVLFTEDEEIGGVGAKKFVKDPTNKEFTFNYMIEFDRANANDAVFYDCTNDEFTKFIESTGFYKTAHGSYSDISTVAPFVGCAAVNLSCGYHSAHTKDEYVNLGEMEESIQQAARILSLSVESPVKYEYIEDKHSWKSKYGLYYGGYDYGGYDYGEFYDYLIIYEQDGEEWMETVSALSEEEAVGIFCMTHKDIPYSMIVDIEMY